jgi:SAM-dependent methyltransferase
VLVPGCGTGHDVRALAAEGVEVIGLDIAPRGIDKAETFPVSCGERYELGDFLNLGKQYHHSFDWIVEHTCLCAIDPSEREALCEISRSSSEAGRKVFSVIFFEKLVITKVMGRHIQSAVSKVIFCLVIALSWSNLLCRNKRIQVE